MTAPESGRPDVIDAAALAERLRRGPVTVLDVRRPERWGEDRERIPGEPTAPERAATR